MNATSATAGETPRLFVEGSALEVPITGVGSYTQGLLEQMMKEVPELSVIVGVPKGSSIDLGPLEKYHDRVNVVWSDLLTRQQLKLASLSGLGWTVERIYNIPPPNAYLFPNFLSLRVAGPGESLTVVHDATIRKSPKDKSWRSRTLISLLTRRSLGTSRCVAVSHSAADDIRQWFKLESRPPVLYPIVRKPPGVMANASGEGYLLMLGAGSPRKNLEGVLRAMDQLGECAPQLRVLGVQGLRSVSGVSYLGYVSESEKWQQIAGARAVVAASFDEGFDLPVIEALLAGVPVIASDISVHREILGEDYPYFFALCDDERLANLFKSKLESQRLPRDIESALDESTIARRALEWLNIGSD